MGGSFSYLIHYDPLTVIAFPQPASLSAAPPPKKTLFISTQSSSEINSFHIPWFFAIYSSFRAKNRNSFLQSICSSRPKASMQNGFFYTFRVGFHNFRLLIDAILASITELISYWTIHWSMIIDTNVWQFSGVDWRGQIFFIGSMGGQIFSLVKRREQNNLFSSI